MEKPMIVDNKAVKTSLEAGKEYFYCTCGRSKNQSFCDGSHQKFTVEDIGTVPTS